MEDLERQIEDKREEIYQIKNLRSFRMLDVVENTLDINYIVGSFQDVDLQIEYNSIAFKRKKEGYSYPPEMFSLYIKELGLSGDVEDVKDISISYYTTSNPEQWETERLVMLGRLAYMFLHTKDRLIERLNLVRSEYSQAISQLYKELRDLEKVLTEHKALQRKQKLEKFMVQLQEECLSYDRQFIDYLRYKEVYRNVTSAKMLPTKGKTFNIELTVLNWDQSVYRHTVERVKQDRVLQLIMDSVEWKSEQ